MLCNKSFMFCIKKCLCVVSQIVYVLHRQSLMRCITNFFLSVSRIYMLYHKAFYVVQRPNFVMYRNQFMCYILNSLYEVS